HRRARALDARAARVIERTGAPRPALHSPSKIGCVESYRNSVLALSGSRTVGRHDPETTRNDPKRQSGDTLASAAADSAAMRAQNA
ncbi:MAG TPA: hypothetical protein VGD80_21715, partial [Kofleriaceae bacterium]